MVLGIEWQPAFQPPFIHEGKGSPISAPTFSNKPTLVHLKWRWRIHEYFSCSYFVEVQQPTIRLRFQMVSCFTSPYHFAFLLYFWTTELFNYVLFKKSLWDLNVMYWEQKLYTKAGMYWVI